MKSTKYASNEMCKTYSIFLYVGELSDGVLEKEKRLSHFIDYIHIGYNTPVEETIELCVENFSQYYKCYTDHPKKVIVFDLDDTLINRDNELFYGYIWDDLQKYRELFDYIILWSHGSELHVKDNLKRLLVDHDFKFDVILARKETSDEEPTNKGLGQVLKILNRKDGVCTLQYACLVDDKMFNYSHDYDLFYHVSQITPGIYGEKFAEVRDRLNCSDKSILY
jgi:HAD superfamily phosphatase (TIGR01681 family)